jgi:hypothetical protein
MMNTKKINKYLKEGIKVKIPEKLDKKNLEIIYRISRENDKKQFSFFLTPGLAYFALAVVIIPALITGFYFSYQKISNNNEISYRGLSQENIRKLFGKYEIDKNIAEVKNIKIDKVSNKAYLKWDNPVNDSFQGILIEKHFKDSDDLILNGKADNFTDDRYKKGTFYIIKAVSKSRKISSGVKIE